MGKYYVTVAGSGLAVVVSGLDGEKKVLAAVRRPLARIAQYSSACQPFADAVTAELGAALVAAAGRRLPPGCVRVKQWFNHSRLDLDAAGLVAVDLDCSRVSCYRPMHDFEESPTVGRMYLSTQREIGNQKSRTPARPRKRPAPVVRRLDL